ncbi:MAG: tRNA lysidine(34) synthetase TilS [Propionibacteriaceae bacterium]|jgi:tRNA(Ile)-lysidine synthase|nr:tRNA lysidine(34) synthetase TilS [Propionibacteriaceae bacterium]
MTRKALGPATLQLVQAVAAMASAGMLVACSGGADSTALAAAAAIMGKRRGLGVRAVVVDHGLQQGSGRIAELAAERLWTQEIATQIVSVQVDASGVGIEAAARQARYDALQAAAGPAEIVLLGHTLDDQAETVLLGLARGSGIRSLAGMPPARGPFRRPLLSIRRAVTRQACAELALEWWDDPQNAERRFTRARVRHQVLPVLEEELGPGVAEALARTAESARADADCLDALAGQWKLGMDAAALSQLDPAIRLRVIRDWLRENGSTELGSVHLLAVDALVTDWHGQKFVAVPGLRVHRQDGQLNCVAG